MSDLPVTVPQSLHDAMVKVMGENYAISYLCGATSDGKTLFPRTGIARERLQAQPHAMLVLENAGLKLGPPLAKDQRVPIPAVEAAIARFDRTGHF